MAKEVLALDIDDTIVKQAESFVLWSNETWGTHLTLDDYTEAWHELWDTDDVEVEARRRQFLSDEIIDKFEVIDGAREGIIALSSIKRVVAVTSRRDSLRSTTETALEIIAPGAVDDIVHATSFRGDQKVIRSKATICQEIGALHLIDDQLMHCLDAAENGVSSILFGDYPWNRVPQELPAGIVRVSNWALVLDYFNLNRNNLTDSLRIS